MFAFVCSQAACFSWRSLTLAYLKTTGQARPDVTVIDCEGNLLADFYRVRGEHGPPPTVDFRRHRLEVESTELQRWFAADPARPVYFSGRTNLPEAGPFVQETSGLLMRIRPLGGPELPPASDPWAFVRTEAIERDARRGDALTREIAARYWIRRGEGAFERGDLARIQPGQEQVAAVLRQLGGG